MTRKALLPLLVAAVALLSIEGAARLGRTVVLRREGLISEPPRAALSGLSDERWADYDQLPYAELRPYVMFAPAVNYRSPTVNTNDLGFRAGPVAQPKLPGTMRVVVVGGSAAFGTGASSDAATFPARLEVLLRLRGYRNVEVINAAAPAYVSGQELVRVTFDLLTLEPDVAIIYDGFNDLSSPLLFDPRPGYPSNFPWLEESAQFNSLRRVLAYRLVRLAHESAIGFWSRRLGRESDGGPRAAPEADVAIVATYRRNLDRMAWLFRASGARVLCVFQPTLFGKHPPSADEAAVIAFVERRHGSYARRMRDLLPQAAAAMRDVAAARGARFLDLTTAFDGDSRTVFFDPAHVTDAGNRQIAARLAADVEALL